MAAPIKPKLFVPAPPVDPVSIGIDAVIAGIGIFLGNSHSDTKAIGERQTRDEQQIYGNAALEDAFHRILWKQLLRPMLAGLLDWLRDFVHNPLKALQSLASAIGKLKKIVDDLFVKYIAPILNLLQRVRRLLLLLRVFHIKFAAALDKRLTDIERAISEPYLLLHKKLNEVISTIDLVLNPAGYIRTQVIWGSVIGIINELGAIIRGVTVALPGSHPKEPRRNLLPDVQSQMQRFASGQLNDAERRKRDMLLSVLVR